MCLSSQSAWRPCAGRGIITRSDVTEGNFDRLRQCNLEGHYPRHAARKARRDTPHTHVAPPACDGTKTLRGPHMLLQHAVLRDGSTWAARAWTCVAGHNILPTEQQTNFSSAFQYSTQARAQRVTTHLSCEQGGAAAARTAVKHRALGEKSAAVHKKPGPEGEARGGSAPLRAVKNS